MDPARPWPGRIRRRHGRGAVATGMGSIPGQLSVLARYRSGRRDRFGGLLSDAGAMDRAGPIPIGRDVLFVHPGQLRTLLGPLLRTDRNLPVGAPSDRVKSAVAEHALSIRPRW